MAGCGWNGHVMVGVCEGPKARGPKARAGPDEQVKEGGEVKAGMGPRGEGSGGG